MPHMHTSTKPQNLKKQKTTNFYDPSGNQYLKQYFVVFKLKPLHFIWILHFFKCIVSWSIQFEKTLTSLYIVTLLEYNKK